MIIIERHQNGITLSKVYKGYRVHKIYQGYTIKEAKQLFREYLKELQS